MTRNKPRERVEPDAAEDREYVLDDILDQDEPALHPRGVVAGRRRAGERRGAGFRHPTAGALRGRDLAWDGSGVRRPDSGIDLREAGGGWRMYTRSRFAPYVERLLLDGARPS